MVEQGIYFALGCVITALCALMFAPIFWRRALRLTRKRLQLQVPLSMQEILAERDQLRAEFAVERLRIEQALEKVQASKAADMAEIGRRSVEATTLQSEVASLHDTRRAQEDEIARVTRDMAESGTEASALKGALDEAHARLERWRQRAHEAANERDLLRDDGDRLRDEIAQQRTTLAGLETRAMGLEMRLTDAARGEAGRLKSVEEGLRARLETAMGQATRHETSAIALRRECDDVKARLRGLEDELAAAREREKGIHLQNSLKAEQARRATGSEAAEGSDEDLRSSIHALGLAVAMMSRRTPGASGDASGRAVRADAPSPVDAN